MASFFSGLSRGAIEELDRQRQAREALALSMIQSGRYRPSTQAPTSTYGQRFKQQLTGPQLGGENISLYGQPYQYVSPEQAFETELGQFKQKAQATQDVATAAMQKEFEAAQAAGLVRPPRGAMPSAAPMMSLPSGQLGDISGQTIPYQEEDLTEYPYAYVPGKGLERDPNFLSPAQRSITKRQETSNIMRLKSDLEKLPEVKDYKTIATSIGAIQKLIGARVSGDIKNSVGVEQAIITLFNKLTDPQSVVRESEYARTPENLPIINRMIGAIGKVNKGGAGLTNDDLIALARAAEIIGNERGRMYSETLQNYRQFSTDLGVDPELVLRGMKEHTPYEATDYSQYSNRGGKGMPTPKGTFNEGQTATNPQTKQKIIFKGGQWQPM